MLSLPETATLEYRDSRLYVSGTASQQWLKQAREIAGFVLGVDGPYPGEGFLTIEMGRILDMKALVENFTIIFPVGSSRLNPGDYRQITTVARTITQLNGAASAVGIPIQIEIIGHSDSTGSDAMNALISGRRADRVRDALVDEGFSINEFLFRGVGATDPADGLSPEMMQDASRRVSFHVLMADSTGFQGDGE